MRKRDPLAGKLTKQQLRELLLNVFDRIMRDDPCLQNPSTKEPEADEPALRPTPKL